MGPVRYIVFEGIDGSGKTTQLSLLCDRLTKHNYSPIRLAEPTYGKLGRKIRETFRTRDNLSVDRQKKLLTLDREEHIRSKIEPLLNFVQKNAAFLIVQDRCYVSAPAYQAKNDNEIFDLLEEQQTFAPKPDIIFLIDVLPDIAIARLNDRDVKAGTFDDLETLERIRERYLKLASVESENIQVVEGDNSPQAIAKEIWESLNLEYADV